MRLDESNRNDLYQGQSASWKQSRTSNSFFISREQSRQCVCKRTAIHSIVKFCLRWVHQDADKIKILVLKAHRFELALQISPQLPNQLYRSLLMVPGCVTATLFIAESGFRASDPVNEMLKHMRVTWMPEIMQESCNRQARHVLLRDLELGLSLSETLHKRIGKVCSADAVGEASVGRAGVDV